MKKKDKRRWMRQTGTAAQPTAQLFKKKQPELKAEELARQ